MYFVKKLKYYQKNNTTFNILWYINIVHYSEKKLLPKSTKKIYLPNPNKKKIKIEKNSIKIPPTFEIKQIGPRLNYLQIQMLSINIYKQIFPENKQEKISSIIIDKCKKNLMKFNIKTNEKNYLPDVDFQLPPLIGKNIEEHFTIIGEQQCGPYRKLALDFLKGLPVRPKIWLLELGWTRYEPGKQPENVPYPLEDCLVFDTEVCMKAGKIPTLATAVSNTAWYGWISSNLINGSSKPVTKHQYYEDFLIPWESTNKKEKKLNDFMKKPKLIIGHNVSYDRARIKEQYWLEKTGTRFLDTLSLHVCVNGITSYQRTLLKSKKFDDTDDTLKNTSSLNNLNDVYKLYCDKSLSKETRDIFVEGNLIDIKNNFLKVMDYCSNDVIATYEVFEKLFPLFLQRFEHPVTLAGILELGTGYLPINSNWNRYLTDCEQTYEDLDTESRILLARKADQACQLLHNEKYKEDLWMWDQDWIVKNLKQKKIIKKKTVNNFENVDKEEFDDLDKKFSYLFQTKEHLSTVNTLLPGYPNWYRKLCSKPNNSNKWIPGPNLISTSMQITPKLLSLTWEGYPLHYIRDKGWGFLVPFCNDTEIEHKLPLKQLLIKCPLNNIKDDNLPDIDITNIVQNNLTYKEYYSKLKSDKTNGTYHGSGIWCSTTIDDCCWFFKLPHKNGSKYNVGNPLAKDFLNKFSENVLAGDTENAEKVLSIARMLSYWRNNRNRIFDQMIIWLKNENYGAIVPQVIVCGTLTRRAVEATWMTASNANRERVGSELRAIIQAPPGYNIVGADVDSQELWIASIIGDAYYAKLHGATPFGWMTISGNKNEETDMHSVTAKAVGISRDHAKIINYARIYGASQNFAERLLKQFNPSMSEGEARSKALKMFELTKGKKIYHLKKEYLLELPDKPYSKWQAIELAKTFGKPIDELFHKPKWIGGTESAMFNKLEDIANSSKPLTPFLNSSLSKALEPKSTLDDHYLPTRVNWVVQSGAVDFLHLMLVCMKWILGDKGRFCLSFHDEIRYLVPENFKYQTALAMHVTNLFTRCFCSSKLGIYDLPQSVAFFSSVEVDKVLRKDAKHDCKTPSNPHGLEKGYNIPNGESLNIYEAIEKASGEYKCWYKILQK